MGIVVFWCHGISLQMPSSETVDIQGFRDGVRKSSSPKFRVIVFLGQKKVATPKNRATTKNVISNLT
jgi:hypothetical protein